RKTSGLSSKDPLLMSEFPPMDLQTFFYSFIGFTAIMGFRTWQKMGRTSDEHKSEKLSLK
ncbi:MAG: hypothetical protein ACKN88_06210, partial [Candidatus Nanopelagicus sp.]